MRKTRLFVLTLPVGAMMILDGCSSEKAVKPDKEDAVNAVCAYLVREAQEEYTISLEFTRALYDEEETEWYCKTYKGSELAVSKGQTNEDYDSGRIAAVYAEYYVEYDGTMVPDISGQRNCVFPFSRRGNA